MGYFCVSSINFYAKTLSFIQSLWKSKKSGYKYAQACLQTLKEVVVGSVWTHIETEIVNRGASESDTGIFQSGNTMWQKAQSRQRESVLSLCLMMMMTRCGDFSVRLMGMDPGGGGRRRGARQRRGRRASFMFDFDAEICIIVMVMAWLETTRTPADNRKLMSKWWQAYLRSFRAYFWYSWIKRIFIRVFRKIDNNIIKDIKIF